MMMSRCLMRRYLRYFTWVGKYLGRYGKGLSVRATSVEFHLRHDARLGFKALPLPFRE